jgi:hypothetical protein
MHVVIIGAALCVAPETAEVPDELTKEISVLVHEAGRRLYGRALMNTDKTLAAASGCFRSVCVSAFFRVFPCLVCPAKARGYNQQRCR